MSRKYSIDENNYVEFTINDRRTYPYVITWVKDGQVEEEYYKRTYSVSSLKYSILIAEMQREYRERIECQKKQKK